VTRKSAVHTRAGFARGRCHRCAVQRSHRSGARTERGTASEPCPGARNQYGLVRYAQPRTAGASDTPICNAPTEAPCVSARLGGRARAVGPFALRIDDTDLERNRPEYEQLIYESLGWLASTGMRAPTRAPVRALPAVANASTSTVSTRPSCSRKARLQVLLHPRGARGRAPAGAAREDALQVFARCLIDPPRTAPSLRCRFKVPGGEVKFRDMIRGEMVFDALPHRRFHPDEVRRVFPNVSVRRARSMTRR